MRSSLKSLLFVLLAVEHSLWNEDESANEASHPIYPFEHHSIGGEAKEVTGDNWSIAQLLQYILR